MVIGLATFTFLERQTYKSFYIKQLALLVNITYFVKHVGGDGRETSKSTLTDSDRSDLLSRLQR